MAFIKAIYWDKIRLNLLVLTGCGVLLFVVKSVIDPTSTKPESAVKYNFPKTIDLANWKFLSSYDLKTNTPPLGLISSRAYQYNRSNISLTIEMRYTVEKGGNLLEFVKQYTPENARFLGTAARQDRYQESTGFYTLFMSKDTAHLVSCINPRGGSTITPKQFNSNRYRYDLELGRLTNWMLGKGNIRDLRCLWTQLSVPVGQLESNKAYLLLESAWIDWYKWWYPRFPKEY